LSTRVRESLTNGLGRLRHEPIAKRIRALLGETTVVDTSRAMLVWEPRRVVPSYAVPIEDLQAELAASEAAATASDDVGHRMSDVSARPVLDPSIPFRVHTAEGMTVDVTVAGQTLAGACARLDDPDLAGYVVLDFSAFDDPFHRVDVLASSRRVRIELGGELLAESSRPVLLFETMLPTRYYLPREDIRAIAFFDEKVDVFLDGQARSRPTTPWS
jgi:uncharacterized protein (DUF427 family)